MPISATVQQCLTRFKGFEQVNEQSSGLKDEHGRFRVWVGNVAAHRPGGRRSLEYRLRDSSNLQSMVMALLKDMLNALEELGSLFQDSSSAIKTEPFRSPAENAQILHEQDSSDEDDEYDAQLFGLEAEEKRYHDPIARILEEIREINLCLLRFSMTLRNPARHDEMKESASTSTEYYVRYDTDHVRQKFPHAQPYLQERLGKAISKHRQYFKYREEHHSKLAEGLDDGNAAANERPSTIATSLHAPDLSAVSVPNKDEGLETESLYTATSFAPTTAGDATLRPPPLPEAGREGSPFECPLCFGIVIADDERSWRQHIYEDLPPYVCTYAECITANQRYSRRRDWQRHQTKSHNRHWLCPFACSQQLESEIEFSEHLVQKHGQKNDLVTLQRLSQACVVSHADVSDLTCPLCQKVSASSKLWVKHIGHHLEQLALHALPQHVFVSESEDESAVTERSSRSDKSSLSDVIAVSPVLTEENSGSTPGVDVENGPPDAEGRIGRWNDSSFGVDPEVDPQLAPALKMSMEDIDGEEQTEREETLDERLERQVAEMEAMEAEHEAREKAFKEKRQKEKAAENTINVDAVPEEWKKEEELRLNTTGEASGNSVGEAKDLERQTPNKVEGEKQPDQDLEEFLQKQSDKEEDVQQEQAAVDIVDRPEIRNRFGRFRDNQDQTEIEAISKLLNLNPQAPVFAKIHRDYLEEATLMYYDLPFETDRDDDNYLTVLREMDNAEKKVLFEHTRRLRAGNIVGKGSIPSLKTERSIEQKGHNVTVNDGPKIANSPVIEANLITTVHREDISEGTLTYFDIPYERDQKNPDLYIVKRALKQHELDHLKSHTQRFRNVPDFWRQSETPFRNARLESGSGSLSNIDSLDLLPRLRLTTEQHDILEAHFGRQPKPSTSTKRDIAETLNVSLDKVNNWFQNRRAKAKYDARRSANQDMEPTLSQNSGTALNLILDPEPMDETLAVEEVLAHHRHTDHDIGRSRSPSPTQDSNSFSPLAPSSSRAAPDKLTPQRGPGPHQETASIVPQLAHIEDVLYQLQVKCRQFVVVSRTLDNEDIEQQHKALFDEVFSELLMKLDALDTMGNPEARDRRKQLVAKSQTLLNDLDRVLASRTPE